MSTKSRIVIRNFKKKYHNCDIKIDHLILDNKVTLFIGHNGSGKSTLLKAMANLISFRGDISPNLSYSYMPENPCFPKDTTVNNFLSKLYQLNKNDYDYKGLLTNFSLEEKLHEKISTLSKGMQSKLNLIQCLMQSSDIYLLDEPLSGLDEESVKILVEYIVKSEKRYIVSSHIENPFRTLSYGVVYFDQFT